MPFGTLLVPYLRGEAFLMNRDGASAAVEFQKILDHPGIALNAPVGVLAHLQLARAYAVQGDTIRARQFYQAFLSLWQNADPHIPVLLQAHSELSRLPAP